MSIGTGVALFVLGAILVFALNLEIPFLDLDMVGYILMGAGLVTFIIGVVLLARRRQSISTTRVGVDSVTGERVQQGVTEVDDAATRVV